MFYYNYQYLRESRIIMKRNMNRWVKELLQEEKKRPVPVLSFPAIQLMGITVKELISSSDLQAEGMRLVAERVNSAASVSLMDLSIEAECFGSEIKFSDDEVPTVIGSIVSTEEEAKALRVPSIGEGRTGIHIEAIEKVTSFLIEYCNAYKGVGANGIVLAEPLAGLLSPSLADEFSAEYVKKLVDAVQDEEFIVIYHNCGNSVIPSIQSITTNGCPILHFGNAIKMDEILPLIPSHIVAMGNVASIRTLLSRQVVIFHLCLSGKT